MCAPTQADLRQITLAAAPPAWHGPPTQYRGLATAEGSACKRSSSTAKQRAQGTPPSALPPPGLDTTPPGQQRPSDSKTKVYIFVTWQLTPEFTPELTLELTPVVEFLSLFSGVHDASLWAATACLGTEFTPVVEFTTLPYSWAAGLGCYSLFGDCELTRVVEFLSLFGPAGVMNNNKSTITIRGGAQLEVGLPHGEFPPRPSALTSNL